MISVSLNNKNWCKFISHDYCIYRFDMTGEVLEYMEAALKLQETGKHNVLPEKWF